MVKPTITFHVYTLIGDLQRLMNSTVQVEYLNMEKRSIKQLREIKDQPCYSIGAVSISNMFQDSKVSRVQLKVPTNGNLYYPDGIQYLYYCSHFKVVLKLLQSLLGMIIKL